MADPVAKAVTASPSPSEKEKEESTTEGKDSSTPTEQRVSSPGPAPASSSSSGGTFTFFNTPELLRQGIEARNQNDLDRSCELLERALHSLSEKTGISEANYPPEYGEYFLEYGKTMLEVAREAIGNIEEMFLQGRADADAMEDPNEDFEVVWENLEVARVIYEKHPEYKESRIIDVHHALGEMHLELEQFEEAEAEFNTTLGLVLKEPKEGTHIAREERELHFLIGLTHNQNCLSKLRKIEETKKLGENTTEILTEATALKEKCLAAWSLAKSSMEKERESTENGDEKNQLSSVIQTLEEKMQEIEQQVKEIASWKVEEGEADTSEEGVKAECALEKDSIHFEKTSLASKFTAPQAVDGPVHDISHLVRKKPAKRRKITPTLLSGTEETDKNSEASTEGQ